MKEASRGLERLQTYIGIALLLSALAGVILLVSDRALWILAPSHGVGLVGMVIIDALLGFLSLAAVRAAYVPSLVTALSFSALRIVSRLKYGYRFPHVRCKMKTNVIVVLAIIALLAGIGVGYAGATSLTAPKAPTPATITLVSEGHSGGNLGTDGKTHDTVIPSNFTINVGQVITLTIINYDEGPHTLTSSTLPTSTGTGVNFEYPGATGTGVPSVTHFTFTATKAGVYRWWCTTPCDAGQGGWAMTTGSDGQAGQLGFMGGYITVVA